MKDRYMNGFIAGLCGGVAATAINLLFIELLHFGSLRYGDFAGIIVFGHRPKAVLELAIAYFSYFGYASTLGIVFAYFIPYLSPHYYYFKSLHYGAAIWFISYAVTMLFKVPDLIKISDSTATVNLLASVVYGLVLAWLLRKLERASESRPS